MCAWETTGTFSKCGKSQESALTWSSHSSLSPASCSRVISSLGFLLFWVEWATFGLKVKRTPRMLSVCLLQYLKTLNTYLNVYFLILKVFFMCVGVLLACRSVCHMHGCFPSRPKEALGPLELELWMLGSHHVGVGNQTQVLRKSSHALNHGAISPVPAYTDLVLKITVVFRDYTISIHSHTFLAFTYQHANLFYWRFLSERNKALQGKWFF